VFATTGFGIIGLFLAASALVDGINPKGAGTPGIEI
jgi:hypothetical protein